MTLKHKQLIYSCHCNRRQWCLYCFWRTLILFGIENWERAKTKHPLLNNNCDPIWDRVQWVILQIMMPEISVKSGWVESSNTFPMEDGQGSCIIGSACEKEAGRERLATSVSLTDKRRERWTVDGNCWEWQDCQVSLPQSHPKPKSRVRKIIIFHLPHVIELC